MRMKLPMMPLRAAVARAACTSTSVAPSAEASSRSPRSIERIGTEPLFTYDDTDPAQFGTDVMVDGGWAYFSFDGPGGLKEATAPFPRSANCYSCHSQHGAVEWTFAQFYPRLFEVAKQKGTVRADYDPAMKAK